jgi:hypothetical protein
MNIQEIVSKMDIKKKIIAVVAGTSLAGGGYYYLNGSTVSPQQAVSTGMHKETNVRFTVLSGRDNFNPKTKEQVSSLLNNTAKWQDSTLAVYIDAKTCPGHTFRSLQGKDITVHGVVTEYKDKLGKTRPEIKVTDPKQIKVN